LDLRKENSFKAASGPGTAVVVARPNSIPFGSRDEPASLSAITGQASPRPSERAVAHKPNGKRLCPVLTAVVAQEDSVFGPILVTGSDRDPICVLLIDDQSRKLVVSLLDR
jgi:hypothetical protein